jgi:hypothetical protein
MAHLSNFLPFFSGCMHRPHQSKGSLHTVFAAPPYCIDATARPRDYSSSGPAVRASVRSLDDGESKAPTSTRLPDPCPERLRVRCPIPWGNPCSIERFAARDRRASPKCDHARSASAWRHSPEFRARPKLRPRRGEWKDAGRSRRT